MSFLDREARLRPVQFLVILLLPLIYGAGPWWVLGLALAGLLAKRMRGDVPAPAAHLTLFSALLGLLWLGLATIPDQGAWPFAPEGSGTGVGTVIAEAPVSRRGTTPFRFRIEEIRRGDWAGRASAVVTVRGFRGTAPATGSRWIWEGVIQGRDTLVWASGRPAGWAAPWWQSRAETRLALDRLLEPVGPAPAALAKALLIGAVDDLSPWEKQSFRDAGCSHVLALSGMHLSLLALALTLVFHRRAPPLVVFLGIQTTLGVFCFLAGPIPSLLRAWMMALLAGLWTLNQKPVPGREVLSQSFLATVFLWPAMASTLSLQLSFLALAGLFWWSRRWEWVLRPYVGRWVALQLASSASALVATVPLTLTLFGEVRWIGLIMTPPLVLLTTVYLVGAVLAVLAGLLLPASAVGLAAPVFDLLYQGIFGCTAWAASVPAWGPEVALPLLITGGLGALTIFLYNKMHRRACLPVSLNYDSPASLQAFLDEKGYNALKRWGQNFLINAGARRQILDALALEPGEPVWEIGPGLGALTHHLVEAGHPLTVFEIDPGYVGFLKEEFGTARAGFKVVEGDVVKTWKSEPRPGRKTVGNLPYNAASAIVADFIDGGFFPEVFVVTVQLEMAQRMTASPGHKNYSSFSVLCQSAFRLDEVVTLKPGSFYPSPEVTSRVVRLRPHGLYPGLDHHRFSLFVRECFSSRRKTLRNNLTGAAAALDTSVSNLTAAFSGQGIDLSLRAEVLSVDQFVRVYQAV